MFRRLQLIFKQKGADASPLSLFMGNITTILGFTNVLCIAMATITSQLSVTTNINMPFTSMETLARQLTTGKYRLLARTTPLIRTTTSPVTNNVMKRLKQDKEFKKESNPKQLLDLLVNSKVDYVYAVYSTSEVFVKQVYLSRRRNILANVMPELENQLSSWLFRKGFKYTENFNRAILSLTSQGLIQRATSNVFTTPNTENKLVIKSEHITFNMLKPVQIIMNYLYASSVILFAFEACSKILHSGRYFLAPLDTRSNLVIG